MSRTVWMLLGLMACGGAEVTVTEPAPAPNEAPAPAVAKDSPEGLANTANAIAKDPAKQDEILKAEGWTAEAFEAAIVAIAKDPAKRKAYAAARKKG